MTPSDPMMEELRQLEARHPQLTEKAIADLVNGLEVVRDHLHTVEQENSSFPTRLLSAVTGTAWHRQSAINMNLEAGLSTATTWLQDLQISQAKSDLTISIVANHLRRLRDQASEDAVQLRTALEGATEKLSSRLDALEHRVEGVELEVAAIGQLDLVTNRWRQEREGGQPALAAAIFLVSELWWGDFGRFLRHAADVPKHMRLFETAQRKIAEAITQNPTSHVARLVPTQTLLDELDGLSPNSREAIRLLTKPISHRAAPLHGLISSDRDAVLELGSAPKVLSPLGMARRLLHESKRAMNTEAIHES